MCSSMLAPSLVNVQKNSLRMLMTPTASFDLKIPCSLVHNSKAVIVSSMYTRYSSEICKPTCISHFAFLSFCYGPSLKHIPIYPEIRTTLGVKYSRSLVLQSYRKGLESEGLSFNLCVALLSCPCP